MCVGILGQKRKGLLEDAFRFLGGMCHKIGKGLMLIQVERGILTPCDLFVLFCRYHRVSRL